MSKLDGQSRGSSSSSPSRLFPRNIVVAGETGVGKSSFIDLVTGSTTAVTAKKRPPPRDYPWETDDNTHAFRLWDTPGLDGGLSDSRLPPAGQHALRILLRELSKEKDKEGGGVHLLVVCMRGITITEDMKHIYDVILRIRNQVSPEVPIVAVVTKLEGRFAAATDPVDMASMETWWTDNAMTLADSRTTISGHACLMPLPLDSHLPAKKSLYVESQRLARKLLIDHALPLVDIPASLWLKPARNIVIVGGAGVGKSSFINLLVGFTTASSSNSLSGVTTHVTSHLWETDSQMHAFRLWDTPGLDEGSFGNISPQQAQHSVRTHLRLVEREGGGVHLLVVCMRGGPRVSRGMKLLYDIIIDIRNQVSQRAPVVAVVTEMEKRCDPADMPASMETWWTDNVGELGAYDMKFVSHVCLTTIPDDRHPPMEGRYAECQRLARKLLIDHALPLISIPTSLSLKLIRNIVVVGEIDVRKKPIIDLITGKNTDTVAHDILRCYDWVVLPTQTFRLWDTPGLQEGQRSPDRHRAVWSLLTELGRGAGVHLLIFCFPGRRILKSTKHTYDTVLALRDTVCPDTPLVAVVTELQTNALNMADGVDVLATMEQWWHDNASSLSHQHMKFNAHACITTDSDDAYPPTQGRRDECQRLVRDLVIDCSLTPRSVPAKDLHVVLFGETGVGKSSLINLLAGWPVAEVISSDCGVCTRSSTEFQFQLGPTTVRLWDTVGLGNPSELEAGGAIERAAELIRRLNASSGISLFLFCISGERITKTTQRNYRLFYEVLGRKQVPIALVVTHLEKETVMEDWWKRHVKRLTDDGIEVSEHACITTLEGHPKYAESRIAMQELLLQYSNQRKFMMSWFTRLSSLFGLGTSRGKDLVGALTNRCSMEPDVAKKVAICITNNLR